MARMENAAIEKDATILSREKAVAIRENAAYLSKKTICLREEAVSLREEAARAREEEMDARERAVTAREQVMRPDDPVEAAPGDGSGNSQESTERLGVAFTEIHQSADHVHPKNAQLHHLAHHDPLTDLPDRAVLQDRLSEAIKLARSQDQHFAMLFVDIDQFNRIDSLGPEIRDKLLQSVAQRMVACVRHSDTVSRQDGNEFLVLLSHIKNTDDAALSARKILAALVVPHVIDQLEIRISASIRICTCPDDGQNAETLLKSADSTIYPGKETTAITK
ncbi:MAG: diguanylate cyclase [Nitrosospira sp.]